MIAAPERSFGAVVRDISGNIDRIVRAEMRFAIAEFRLRVEAAGGAALLIMAGGACALLAIGFLLLGAMFALARVMPMWLAAVVVATVVGGAGIALFVAGRARLAPPAESHVLPVVSNREPFE
jgi:hypothetical protein